MFHRTQATVTIVFASTISFGLLLELKSSIWGFCDKKSLQICKILQIAKRISCFYLSRYTHKKSEILSHLLPIPEYTRFSMFDNFVMNILQIQKQYLKKNYRSAKNSYHEKHNCVKPRVHVFVFFRLVWAGDDTGGDLPLGGGDMRAPPGVRHGPHPHRPAPRLHRRKKRWVSYYS